MVRATSYRSSLSDVRLKQLGGELHVHLPVVDPALTDIRHARPEFVVVNLAVGVWKTLEREPSLNLLGRAQRMVSEDLTDSILENPR